MDLLHPYAELDVLARYSKISPYLETFLGKKEIASKIVGEDFVALKRGTQMPPLYISDFHVVDTKFLQLRATHHLDDVKKQISEKQALLRKYFVPRKLVNFFYATNNEYGTTMERIFIDIDRQDNKAQDAQQVASSLIKIIQKDKELAKLITFKLLTLWTGSSFHIMLILKKPIDHKAYDTYFSYGKDKTKSFVTKRAQAISQETNLTVHAGHARKKGTIILDTSNTPSGKLARCPFSLHIKDYKTIDGICVPVTIKELDDKKLIPKLRSLTPELVWQHIKQYDKILNKDII